MPLWGKLDLANNSPIYATLQVNLSTNTTNRAALYQNNTPGAFLNNNVAQKKTIGIFGVSAPETSNTQGEGYKVPHSGWNLRVAGSGPLASLTVTSAGKLYTNGDIITVNPGVSAISANATAVIATNGLGNIISTSITSVGAGFTNATPTAITVANSTGGTTTGSLATFTATAGGRAGRVNYETLVTISGPNSGNLGTTGDDGLLPG